MIINDSTALLQAESLVVFFIKDEEAPSHVNEAYQCHLTKHNYSSCSTASFCNYVTGEAGVVARVRESGFIDDQIVVSTSVNVIIFKGADQFFIFQPLHLTKREVFTNQCCT